MAPRSHEQRIAIHALAVGSFEHAAYAWGAGDHASAYGGFTRGGSCLRCGNQAWGAGDHASAHGEFTRAGIMSAVLAIMPRRMADGNARPMPGELAHMPRRSADSGAGFMPGVRAIRPGRSVWGPLAAACPAQHGVPAEQLDRGVFGIQKQYSVIPT